jgi:catechol 2,3-dioxygenase-like lactoylglutathione lyase family enzyme
VYGQSLQGLTINLISADLERALIFQHDVLGADIVYHDTDFAVVRGYGAEWMIHADHTYDSHPLNATLAKLAHRGGTVELRLHGCDPDKAQAHAIAQDFTVLQSASDKPHGLREAYLLDSDGYLWVPDVPVKLQT